MVPRALCFLALAGILVSLAAMPVQAQAGNHCLAAPVVENTAVAGVLLAGKTAMQLCADDEVASSAAAFTATVGISGPGVTSLVFSATVSTLSANGCSFSSWSTVMDTSTVASSATASATVTMSATHCRAIVDIQVVYGSPPVLQVRQRLTVNTDATPTSFTVDNLNRFCAASAIGAACTTPGIDVSQAGAWTISDDAGGWAVHQDPLSLAPGGVLTVSGIPDTQDEMQAIADAIAAGFTVQFGNATFGNMTVPATVRVVNDTMEEWVPVWFFALLMLAAGFLEQRAIRAVLVGLGGAGIFVSWLDGAPIGPRTIIALIAAVVVVFVIVGAWRKRRAESQVPGE